MKKIYPLILAAFIISSSCSNEKTSGLSNKTKEDASLKQQFIPALNGIWVLTDYINEIERTLSPLKSSEKLHGIVSMEINTTAASDSIEVGANYNNHEGYNFTVFFETGHNANSLKTNIQDYEEHSNFYELGYETIKDETFLFLYHYNKSKKLLKKSQYSKVGDSKSKLDAASGLQYMVNKKLFTGSYLLTDSLNSTTNIKMNSDGSLTGHKVFKNYHILTDFMGGPETTLDGIVFNLYEDNSSWYTFTIKKDAILLHHIMEDEETGEPLKTDKIAFKLVRQ
jgi:hypothetical protein